MRCKNRGNKYGWKIFSSLEVEPLGIMKFMRPAEKKILYNHLNTSDNVKKG